MTLNLGQIQALFINVNPPSNQKMLWYDTNPLVNSIKYYDVNTSTWTVLGGSTPPPSSLAKTWDDVVNSTDVINSSILTTLTGGTSVVIFLGGTPIGRFDGTNGYNSTTGEVTGLTYLEAGVAWIALMT